MSIQGDVQFINQLKYKTRVSLIEKFTYMTSILNAVAQFHYYLEKVVSISCFFCDYSFIPSMLRICARQIVIHNQIDFIIHCSSIMQ